MCKSIIENVYITVGSRKLIHSLRHTPTFTLGPRRLKGDCLAQSEMVPLDFAQYQTTSRVQLDQFAKGSVLSGNQEVFCKRRGPKHQTIELDECFSSCRLKNINYWVTT